ncbi:lipoyl(octanoyl) transferase LipB [Pararhodospirillum photometricum]|nr:lipoyl(octanoyl) transferase LipB [Pararhodospirillum photometricum]
MDWLTSLTPIPYPDALARMEARAWAIRESGAAQALWFLEHPPLYTQGTSARPEDLLWPERFPVYAAGRGGQYTYHGPGQRVVYVMMDLERRGRDVRRFVHDLETWLQEALARLGVAAEPRADRVGLWVRHPNGGEDKIAALGIRVRRWVSFHGIALNVAPDLEHFQGIVPCGIQEHGVTSLRALGLDIPMADADAALARAFTAVFGETLTPVAGEP